MPVSDPLLDEITALLDAPAGGDDPLVLERTLTDGYARALNLEAEVWRLQKQIAELGAAGNPGGELPALARRLEERDGSLTNLRSLLLRLRQRHSRAATRVAATRS